MIQDKDTNIGTDTKKVSEDKYNETYKVGEDGTRADMHKDQKQPSEGDAKKVADNAKTTDTNNKK